MNTSYFSVGNFSDFLILGPEHPSSKQHGRRCGCPSCTGKIIDSAAKKYSKLYNLTSFPARTDLAPTNPSPYVNGLLSGTKWGSSGYNPTSTTDLKYYIYDNETLGVDLGSDGINDTGLALDSSGKEKPPSKTQWQRIALSAARPSQKQLIKPKPIFLGPAQ